MNRIFFNGHSSLHTYKLIRPLDLDCWWQSQAGRKVGRQNGRQLRVRRRIHFAVERVPTLMYRHSKVLIDTLREYFHLFICMYGIEFVDFVTLPKIYEAGGVFFVIIVVVVRK